MNNIFLLTWHNHTIQHQTILIYQESVGAHLNIIRVLVGLHFPFQSQRPRDVVAIHPGNIFSPAHPYPTIDGPRNALILLLDKLASGAG